jgi:hypothetical protein
MKTWQQFNDTVNDMLLIDGLRRGRGVERFKDRMIVAGVKDLQSYIIPFMSTPTELVLGQDDFTIHSEGNCYIGSFDLEASRILDVVVRVLPSDSNQVSKFYRLNIYPAHKRYSIISGSHTKRTIDYPGKICFDRGTIYMAPGLEDNETLSILYNQEIQYKPIFECTSAERTQSTPFGDDAALAVHYFVKYHFHKDVNDDQSQAQENFQNYQRERRSLHWKNREYVSSANPTAQLTQSGFVVGND